MISHRYDDNQYDHTPTPEIICRCLLFCSRSKTIKTANEAGTKEKANAITIAEKTPFLHSNKGRIQKSKNQHHERSISIRKSTTN